MATPRWLDCLLRRTWNRWRLTATRAPAFVRLRLEQLEQRRMLDITTVASLMDAPDGANPYGELVQDSNGNLFGTTSRGGAFGCGTIFEFQPGNSACITIATFNGANGQKPVSGLIADDNGNLFGTTAEGGAFGDGTVFEMQRGSGVITTRASFNGNNGRAPDDLVEDSSGNLLGTTTAGGASNYGTVFQVRKGTGAITTLASFDYTSGALPYGSLVEDSSGNLFGTTQIGGTDGYGTVFELKQGNGGITTLASFTGSNGSHPLAGLITDSSDNLFGTTTLGGGSGTGTVFEVLKDSSTITTLANFDSNGGPSGNVILDRTGNLFGVAGGGAFALGRLFELTQGSGNLTTVASFDATNRYANSLLEDSSGNFFGTSLYGISEGAVFDSFSTVRFCIY